MASYKDVDKYLSDLPLGEHKLTDIIARILSINSKKHRTQVLLSKQAATKEYLEKCAVDNDGKRYSLKDVKVDITYQRSLRLKVIFKNLDTKDIFSGEDIGFDIMLAGAVDLVIRPDGDIFVWDGFRRCILAMLKGLDGIPANVERHPESWTGKNAYKCRKKEAFCFTRRNKNETMKAEELFKAGVIEEEPDYLKVKDALSNCDLDVSHVLPGNTKLGGYKEFENAVLKKPFDDANYDTLDYLIEASSIIRGAFGKNIGEVSGHLLTGMACFLLHNAESEDADTEFYIEPEELTDVFEDYVLIRKGTQSMLTKDRIHSCSRESVAWKIATKVYMMDRVEAAVMMGLSDEIIEQLIATR